MTIQQQIKLFNLDILFQMQISIYKFRCIRQRIEWIGTGKSSILDFGPKIWKPWSVLHQNLSLVLCVACSAGLQQKNESKHRTAKFLSQGQGWEEVDLLNLSHETVDIPNGHELHLLYFPLTRSNPEKPQYSVFFSLDVSRERLCFLMIVFGVCGIDVWWMLSYKYWLEAAQKMFYKRKEQNWKWM